MYAKTEEEKQEWIVAMNNVIDSIGMCSVLCRYRDTEMQRSGIEIYR